MRRGPLLTLLVATACGPGGANREATDEDIDECCACLTTTPRFAGSEQTCFVEDEEDGCRDALLIALDGDGDLELDTDGCGSVVCRDECMNAVIGDLNIVGEAFAIGETWYGKLSFEDGLAPSWTDAVDLCGDIAGHLVRFEDGDEAFEVKDAELFGWIGLNDRETEGAFQWTDGTAWNPLSANDWAGGEPNDEGGEDCVQLKDDGWNDASCADALPAICEVEP